MPSYHEILKEGFEAENDLSGQQYRAVVAGTNDNQVDAVSSAGVQVEGILANDPASGETATVVQLGRTLAEVGGSVSRGDRLTPAADGQLVTATAANVDASSTSTSEDVAGDPVAAVAMEGAGGAGEVIEVFVVALIGPLF